MIVNSLSKSGHFILVKVKYTTENLAHFYISHIIRLHGVPISILSDRGSLFKSYFWKVLQYGLDTQLDLNIIFQC